MIFTADGVDFPDKLLQALDSDRLVVFVGAGVSMRAYKDQPPDTYYPGFQELAEQIAQRIGHTISEKDKENLRSNYVDRVLGEWDDKTGDIKGRAAAILQTNETGQRLDQHRAIIRLFTPKLTPRIVTTNFDRLLIRALKAEDRKDSRWKITVAPSLPPVKRFSGICYLHGRVDEPDDMVLTDKDIGRAYMDEGWALRFAHGMFQQFDVLFIGYSLRDPPLRYLSLALEGTTERGRWALIPNKGPSASGKAEEERDWQRRHVEPIWYTAKDCDYRALERTIDAWGVDNSRSFLDRRNVLAQFGKSKPDDLRPHDLSRAKYFLQDPASLRDFAKESLDIDWFDRLLLWGHFDFLIKEAGNCSEADGFLAERFVDWMISNPVEILGRITEHRATLNIYLFDRFCRRYQEGKAPDVDVKLLRHILEFFRPVIGQRRSFLFASSFVKRVFTTLLDEGYVDDVFWLLGIALCTRSEISKSISFAYEYARLEGQSTESTPQYELRYELKFDNQMAEYNVNEISKHVFLPRIGAIGFRLAHFLTLKFLELRATDSRGKTSDVRSHQVRPAIASHAHNNRDDPVNFLLDLLRDHWEALLAVDRAKAGDGKDNNWQATSALFVYAQPPCRSASKQMSKVPEGHPFTEVSALDSH
jgi:hypothetical protein